MATQIGTTRVYTSKEDEMAASAVRVKCVRCGVSSVPRGLTSTRTSAVGEKQCPNCGKVHGRKNH